MRSGPPPLGPKPSRRALELLFAVFAAGCIAVAVAIFLTGKATLHPRPAFAGTLVDPPKLAADFVLPDDARTPAHLFDPAAGATYLFFGYTHCPDECPLALASLGRALRMLPAPMAAQLRIEFVTVDPQRDTPAVIKRYLATFDPRFEGFGGTLEQLKPVWNAYGVAVDPRTKEIAHGDAIYAIDRTRHVVLIYPADAAPASLAADMRALLSS